MADNTAKKTTSFNISPNDPSALAFFGITFLLVSPSDLENVKTDPQGIARFLDDAGITGTLHTELSDFVQAIAQDDLLVTQMQLMGAALRNSAITSGIYDQPICPQRPLSTTILSRLAKP